MFKKIISHPATSLTSFLLSLFFAFIALPLLAQGLFEFASLFTFQLGILSVLFFIFGSISFSFFILDKERKLALKIIFGALVAPLIFIFLNSFYAEAKKVYKEGESSWSPLRAIVEKFLPHNYVVTNNPNDTEQGKSVPADPEIENLIFAESNTVDSNNRKIIFFQLDSNLNKKVINEINTLDYGFEGFVENGKAFVMAKHEGEDWEITNYFYSKTEKGSSLKEISKEEARWLLAEPEGRLSPDRKKMIDYSPPTESGKYFYYLKGGGTEELLSYYYPPGSTNNYVENVLWIDDQNIAWSEKDYNLASATTEIKTMNILSREKQTIVKISETSANSGARIWFADPEKIIISSFGNAGQTFSVPDGKIIYEVPASTTQPRSEIYIFSLKDKSLRRLTDNPPYTDFYDKDLIVSPNRDKAVCLNYDKLIIVDLQEPWETKTHFIGNLVPRDALEGGIEDFAFAQ